MSFAISYTTRARGDLRKIVAWLDQQGPNRADRFEAAIRKVEAELAIHPTIYRVRERSLRRVAVPGFETYGVFYRVYDQDVTVVLVFNGIRHPARTRLREDDPVWPAVPQSL